MVGGGVAPVVALAATVLTSKTFITTTTVISVIGSLADIANDILE